MAGIKIIEDIFALLSRLIKMNKTSKNNDNKKIASKKENKKKEKNGFLTLPFRNVVRIASQFIHILEEFKLGKCNKHYYKSSGWYKWLALSTEMHRSSLGSCLIRSYNKRF